VSRAALNTPIMAKVKNLTRSSGKDMKKITN